MTRVLKFWPTDRKLCEEIEYVLRSGLQSRNGESIGSMVSRSKGDRSPFQSVRPKLTSYSDFVYPKPYSTHFLVPTGIFRRNRVHIWAPHKILGRYVKTKGLGPYTPWDKRSVVKERILAKVRPKKHCTRYLFIRRILYFDFFGWPMEFSTAPQSYPMFIHMERRLDTYAIAYK